MNNEEARKILEDLVKEYKEEKEFVGQDIIQAIEIILRGEK